MVDACVVADARIADEIKTILQKPTQRDCGERESRDEKSSLPIIQNIKDYPTGSKINAEVGALSLEPSSSKVTTYQIKVSNIKSGSETYSS